MDGRNGEGIWIVRGGKSWRGGREFAGSFRCPERVLLTRLGARERKEVCDAKNGPRRRHRPVGQVIGVERRRRLGGWVGL